jgi:hypothetical protein
VNASRQRDPRSGNAKRAVLAAALVDLGGISPQTTGISLIIIVGPMERDTCAALAG